MTTNSYLFFLGRTSMLPAITVPAVLSRGVVLLLLVLTVASAQVKVSTIAGGARTDGKS